MWAEEHCQSKEIWELQINQQKCPNHAGPNPTFSVVVFFAQRMGAAKWFCATKKELYAKSACPWRNGVSVQVAKLLRMLIVQTILILGSVALALSQKLHTKMHVKVMPKALFNCLRTMMLRTPSCATKDIVSTIPKRLASHIYVLPVPNRYM
jgi:hypothetical protein